MSLGSHDRPEVPKHQQLADVLWCRIDTGAYPLRTRIPSETTLVQETGFARDTVRKAVDVLVGEGRLYVGPAHGGSTRLPVERGATYRPNAGVSPRCRKLSQWREGVLHWSLRGSSPDPTSQQAGELLSLPRGVAGSILPVMLLAVGPLIS